MGIGEIVTAIFYGVGIVTLIIVTVIGVKETLREVERAKQNAENFAKIAESLEKLTK